MNIEDIRTVLCDLADDWAARGTRLNSVRFKYNIEDKCTQVLLSYDEEETTKNN